MLASKFLPYYPLGLNNYITSPRHGTVDESTWSGGGRSPLLLAIRPREERLLGRFITVTWGAGIGRAEGIPDDP